MRWDGADELGLAAGESTGLIEDEGGDLGDALENGGVTDDDALAGGAGNCADEDDRNRD